MVEPTVPMPLSLIEEAADLIESDRGAKILTVHRFRALLSQPTQTEKPHAPSCDGWMQDEGECTCGTAAPPSIADMVPGTTFSFLRVDGVRVRGFVIDGHITIDVEGSAWRHDEIDPSTIRDVTVPTVTP